jgi:hypothetical protein
VTGGNKYQVKILGQEASKDNDLELLGRGDRRVCLLLYRQGVAQNGWV